MGRSWIRREVYRTGSGPTLVLLTAILARTHHGWAAGGDLRWGGIQVGAGGYGWPPDEERGPFYASEEDAVLVIRRAAARRLRKHLATFPIESEGLRREMEKAANELAAPLQMTLGL